MSKTLPFFIEKLACRHAKREAIVYKDEYRTYRYSYKDLYTLIGKSATFFQQNGWKKGDRVIIWSYNAPEWVTLFLTCAQLGIVAVPLDINAPKDLVVKIFKDTKAKAIFLPSYIELDGLNKKSVQLDHYFSLIAKLPVSSKKTKISENDTLEIVYTSGTTSAPKGVIISHKNIVSNIMSLRKVMPIKPGNTFLSTLPLSHMLEQTLGLFVPFRFGGKIVYLQRLNTKSIQENCVSEKINIIVTVPAFVKLLKEKIENNAKQKKMYTKFVQLNKKLSNFPLWVRRCIMKRKIRFLSHFKFFVVGGSALDVSSEMFWEQLGFPVIQGYGMTEASPIIACNTLKQRKVGTVGCALPEQKIKLSPEGEILCQGNNVTCGYDKNKEATQALLKDQWLQTGDLGSIDQDGFLTIKGRKKNMILSDSGLNVYPEDLEDKLCQNKAIKEAIVFGIQEKGQVHIYGVVILKNKQANLKKLLEETNQKLASHQKIHDLISWPEADFPRTPSRKIKRPSVLEKLETLKSNKTQTKKNEESRDPLVLLLHKLTKVEKSKITPKANLFTKLKVDSLKRLELIVEIEQQYGIELEESQIDTQTTFGDLQKIIQKGKTLQTKNKFNFWSYTRWIMPIRLVLQLFLSCILRGFYPIKIKGYSSIKNAKGPFIFVVNHTSHLDTPTLIRALPLSLRLKVGFAAAEDYFFEIETHENKILKKTQIFFLRLLFNVFPFSRSNSVRRSFKIVGASLDRGFSMAIFPEGTRTQNGKMAPFQTGIGILAHNMKVPIIPVKIEGLYEILPKGKTWPKRGRSKVIFGKPFLADPKASHIETTQHLENIIRKL